MFDPLPHITEPSRNIPVLEKTDVLVVDGGQAEIAPVILVKNEVRTQGMDHKSAQRILSGQNA